MGRPGPAANEPLPLVAWALPMQAIFCKLGNLSQAAHEVVDVNDGSDMHGSRIDRLLTLHFETSRLALEHGGRNSSEVIEFLYDAQALILGAQAVDVHSPNREALHKLMLKAIDDVINTDRWEGLDDAELAQILAGLPDPDQVPLIQPQPKNEATVEAKPAEPQKVTLATSLLASGAAGRSLLLRASFDIETLGMNLVKQVVDLGLDHEESCMLRTMAVRICELNSPIMSYLSDDDMVSVGEVHARLNHGALGLPEGVVAA